MEKWVWKPIRNCPGRYVLQGGRPDLSPQEIVGNEIQISAYRTSTAKDTVLVAAIEGGGLISYQRQDGTFLHTLNTPEGFARKLRQLGIPLPGGIVDMAEEEKESAKTL